MPLQVCAWLRVYTLRVLYERAYPCTLLQGLVSVLSKMSSGLCSYQTCTCLYTTSIGSLTMETKRETCSKLCREAFFALFSYVIQVADRSVCVCAACLPAKCCHSCSPAPSSWVATWLMLRPCICRATNTSKNGRYNCVKQCLK